MEKLNFYLSKFRIFLIKKQIVKVRFLDKYDKYIRFLCKIGQLFTWT